MVRHKKQLKHSIIKKTAINVARKTSNNIEFGFDKTVISKNFEPELAELVAATKENGYIIKLSGQLEVIQITCRQD